MKDPVNDFEYPGAWVASCKEPGLLPLVSSGLAVLTADGTVLRRGYTTGTTAAAACKAAILSLKGPVNDVPVTTPSGVVVTVAVRVTTPGSVECRKYAGDYPEDATAGALIIATAKAGGRSIVIRPGSGIGRFSRTTPRYKSGEPAISRPAMMEILHSIEEGLAISGESGALVEFSVPEGETIAKNTLNPRIGILGGISILGTTGLVEPWDDHLTDSVLERVSVADKVVLTTGRTGLAYARIYFPGHEAVLIGSNIGGALSCVSGDVVLFGLPGLILRYIYPEILEGTSCPTVEEMMYHPGYNEKIMEAIDRYNRQFPKLRVVLIDRDGRVTHDTNNMVNGLPGVK